LNAETKRYTVEACRRVKAHGGVVHCFAVGRVFEQENVDWLKQIVLEGHLVGNHTYDHINVLATKPEDLQFRFRRSPWLLGHRPPRDVLVDNIRLTNAALKTRIGIDPAGFRTPGGFANGLLDRPDVRRLLLDLGFTWVSSKYPTHDTGEAGKLPADRIFADIVRAQQEAQPFSYADGLVEVPMSPISDIGAFRNGRWSLGSFLQAIELGVAWAIDNRAVFDFLGHPSCLYVTDPKFRTIELICNLVKNSGDRAVLADLNAIARLAQKKKQGTKT
jgi:peptidoglycan/xylan/chitin deacetylase (PgdA/CDA1 family)